MGFMDRLRGRSDEQDRRGEWTQDAAGAPQRSADEIAIERYRYMLRTAPPEDIERAHEEAFAKLTPEQRRMVLDELSARVPPGERARSDSPRDLARMATRAEIREPGILERTFGGGSGPRYGGGYGGGYDGPGLGSMFFATLAASFVGTAVAQSFFAHGGYDAGYGEGYQEGYQQGQEGDQGDAGSEGDYGGEAGYGEGGYASEADLGGYGGADPGGGDFGGDVGGDFGGDFGGGEF